MNRSKLREIIYITTGRITLVQGGGAPKDVEKTGEFSVMVLVNKNSTIEGKRQLAKPGKAADTNRQIYHHPTHYCFFHRRSICLQWAKRESATPNQKRVNVFPHGAVNKQRQKLASQLPLQEI